MFLKSAWYVMAWGHEVGAKPLSRLILGEPIVFYRKADGSLVALADRCPHRRAPLSLGAVLQDGRIECRYHGLQFDGSGQCMHVPSQGEVPEDMRVRAYPVVERYRWVWIWMGDPAEADPARIPDFHYLDSPGWGAKGTRLHVRANWQLIVDNLLDLTHLAFVHRTTIGNMAVAASADVKVKRSADSVLVTRWMIDKPAPPTYVKAGGFAGNVDRWQIIDFTAPSFLRLSVGASPTGTGAPEGRVVGGINMRNLNAITPETETTTHYFWAQAHDFNVGDGAVTDMLFEQVNTAFHEDVEIFEAQQRVIDGDAGDAQVDINGDSAGIQARLILARLQAAEAAAARARANAASAS